MKAYKGFNNDMTCRGFQFKEGETYQEDNAILCESGFHACENPLDCLKYYAPSDSVYHEVELDEVTDEHDNDSKRCGKIIKIGARLDIAGIVKAHFEYVKSNCDKENASSATGYRGASSATGDYCASSATGYRGASSATGDYGASSATGNCGASSATGDYGASSATGDCGASSATGDYGASSATGYRGASSATGDYGASSATGNCGASSATGDYGASSATGLNCVALSAGYAGKAKAAIGSAICVCERGKWDGETYPLLAIKAAIVDGEKIKADTWYRLENGEFVEVAEDE